MSFGTFKLEYTHCKDNNEENDEEFDRCDGFDSGCYKGSGIIKARLENLK